MTPTPGRVLYLTLQATDPGQAAHAHVGEIVAGLRKRGWHVDLMQVNYGKRPGAIERLWRTTGTQIQAFRALAGADVVYVRWHFLTWPFVELTSALMPQAIVIEVNGLLDDAVAVWPALRRGRRVLQWLMNRQLRLASAVISVTPQLTEVVQSIAEGVPTATVSNGANTDLFFARKQNHRDAQEAPYVVFFGALSPWQGIDTILEAISHTEWPENVRVKIAGDGLARDRVEEMAGLRPDRLDYLGNVPYEEVGRLVRRSLGSLVVKEGDFSSGGLAPLKLYESVACGVPVIVSNQPYMREFVEDLRCGVVIEQRDGAALARAVQRLYQEREEFTKRGRLAAVIVKEQHSWDARAGQTHDLLVRTLS